MYYFSLLESNAKQVLKGKIFLKYLFNHFRIQYIVSKKQDHI